MVSPSHFFLNPYLMYAMLHVLGAEDQLVTSDVQSHVLAVPQRPLDEFFCKGRFNMVLQVAQDGARAIHRIVGRLGDELLGVFGEMHLDLAFDQALPQTL